MNRKNRKKSVKEVVESFTTSPSSSSVDYKNRLRGCRITAIVAFFILLLFNVPWLPRQFEYDLDASWLFALHAFFSGSYAFGSDILWHYGPLGFLFSKYYHPDTYVWLLAGWAILSCILWLALNRTVTSTTPTPDPLVFPIVAIIVVMTHEAIFLLFPTLLFLLCYFSKPSGLILRILLIAGIAIAALVKISYLLFGLGVLIIIDMHRLFSARVIPWMLPLYLLSIVLLWLLCGQSMGDLLPFIRAGMEHASGFGIMAQDQSNPILMPYYLFVCVFLFFTISNAWKEKFGWHALAPFLCFMLTLYTLFKVGFINNNDHHRLQALGTLLCILLLTRDTFWQRVPKWGKILFLVASILAIIGYGLRFYLIPEHAEERRKIASHSTKQSPYASVRNIQDFFAVHSQQFEETMADIRRREPLPRLEEGSDILGALQMALFASQSRYIPRPVFQSYHTYTPYLAKSNLAFLQSVQAPNHLFFTIDVVQGRFPSQDDGLLWPEMIKQYDIDHLYGNYLSLKKRGKTRPISILPIQSHEALLGNAVRVPPLSEDGAIWAKIHIEPTLLGRLAQVLFRNINLYIHYTTNTGYSDMRRLVAATAGEGFVLSPVITNSLQFALMMGGEFPTLSPLGLQEITIIPEPGSEWLARFLYNKTMKIEFSRMRFLRQNIAEIPEWDRDVETLARLTSYPFHSVVDRADTVMDQHIAPSRTYGQNTVRANGQSRLYYPLNGYEKTIHAIYGTYDAFSNTRYLGDGIYFSVEGVERDTEVKQVLWKAFTPPPDPGGMTHQSLRITLPKNLKGVFFNTMPVSPDKSSRGFWSDVRIE